MKMVFVGLIPLPGGGGLLQVLELEVVEETTPADTTPTEPEEFRLEEVFPEAMEGDPD